MKSSTFGHRRHGVVLITTLAFSVILVVPSTAHANYSPKQGRWFQRDPLGVRVDAPRGRITPSKQYTDGMNGYEYVSGNPELRSDPNGQLGIPTRDDVRLCYSPQDRGGPGAWLPDYKPPVINSCVGAFQNYVCHSSVLDTATLGEPMCKKIKDLGVYQELLKSLSSKARDPSLPCGKSKAGITESGGPIRLRPDGSGDPDLIAGVGGFDLYWFTTCSHSCGPVTRTECGCRCRCHGNCSISIVYSDLYTFGKPKDPHRVDNNWALRCFGVHLIGEPYYVSASWVETATATWYRFE